MNKTLLQYPFDSSLLLKKQKSLRRELRLLDGLIEKRIAILGGSTTNLIKDFLELFLLDKGIKPVFYESEYNKFFEDAVFGNAILDDFKPDYIYIHTTYRNINQFPISLSNSTDSNELVDSIFQNIKSVWNHLTEKFSCVIIQNNFEHPPFRSYGNLEQSDHRGQISFINLLNNKINEESSIRKNILINDINYLSAQLGLDRWHDLAAWYSYKYALSVELIPRFSYNLSNLLGALVGKQKKCLVLDLDNTLWGGVIGDDGLGGIVLGHETATGEAYYNFQCYIKTLKERGIMLAVCSKNDLAIAKSAFDHPDSVLKLDDFLSFKANWEPKSENIIEIANELNIGIDSIVFVDDNPAERELVSTRLPAVAVPVMGEQIEEYISILDRSGYFEVVSLSDEDFKRTKFYKDNVERQKVETSFTNYDDYLKSLMMVAEIGPISDLVAERVAQLIGKTNQFNLTTKRMTLAQLQSIFMSDQYITIYGRLMDKFGDNGIITVVIAEKVGKQAKIIQWLMSCRVLKRGMELAMMDALVSKCIENGITEIIGQYIPTVKNEMVRWHYKDLGFSEMNSTEQDVSWKYLIDSKYENKNKYISIQ